MSVVNTPEQRVEEGKHLITDLASGDEKVATRSDFQNLTGSEIQEALALIFNRDDISDSTKTEVLTNAWRIHYRVRPPTIEEFLDPEGHWLGPTAESLYPHVRKWLIDFWQPNSEKRHLVLATAIGTGKSYTSTLWSLFITVHLWAMRNPKRFFGLSQVTSLVHALISFTMDKAQQLLLQPFFQILVSASKFKRVRQEEYLEKTQRDNPDMICWTSAGRIGALQFYNDIHYMVASSPEQLLGLNMITAILSEISFFLDKGFSSEYIWRIYQDSKARVRSRFENKYFSGTVIDSSPNDIELSPIDRYIFTGEAENDPRNMVITGAQWDYLPHKFPEWMKTGKTFPVFRGSRGEPSRILNESEAQKINSDQVLQVPIDVKNLFEENTTKNVKDYAGWPSGSQGVLLREERQIEQIFTPQLKNIYTFITAPADEKSQGLIWDTIAPQFFIKYDSGYEFYRNPKETRYLHVDQAESKDIAAIAMVHPELNKDGEIIYVTDFTIAISPEKARINLDAIRFFIQDLRDKGGIDIGLVTFDSYESSATLNYFKSKGIRCAKLSVDQPAGVYMTYISKIKSNSVKVGRNIFLKNNLKSLQEIRTKSGKKKIEHTKGKLVYDDGADWLKSQMGKFAKDVSDAHCGAVWNAIHEFEGVPTYAFEERKKKEDGSLESYKDFVKDKIKSDIMEKYNLKV